MSVELIHLIYLFLLKIRSSLFVKKYFFFVEIIKNQYNSVYGKCHCFLYYLHRSGDLISLLDIYIMLDNTITVRQVNSSVDFNMIQRKYTNLLFFGIW